MLKKFLFLLTVAAAVAAGGLADKKFLRRARQTAALRDGIKDAV